MREEGEERFLDGRGGKGNTNPFTGYIGIGGL